MRFNNFVSDDNRIKTIDGIDALVFINNSQDTVKQYLQLSNATQFVLVVTNQKPYVFLGVYTW